MTSKGRVATAVVMAIAGLILLAWQIRAVGVAAIVASLSTVGFGFIGILVLSLLRFAVRAKAWTTLLGGGVPLWPALRASIGGDAMGNVTPLRLLASEPAKAMLLGNGVSTTRALAALVVENALYSASVAVAVMLGAAAMLAVFDVGEAVRWAGWLALSGMAALLAGLLWLGWRKPALAGAAMGRVPFIAPARAAALVGKVERFEQSIYSFAGGDSGRLVTVVLCEASFHVFSFAETYLTLWLLTGQSMPLPAFVLDTVGRVINAVFLMVPLRVGVAEAGTGLVAQAIGVGRLTGVSIALVGKARLLAWAAIGLAATFRAYRPSPSPS